MSGTNQLCLRVNACISYRVMCLSWFVFFPETVYIWITLFFKPKMDLISTIIAFGFLEIQSNNVPVDDKSSARRILNQINKTYTCTCLGCAFCFQQHDNVTRQFLFFQSLIHLPQTKQNPTSPDVTVCFFFIYLSSFYLSFSTLFMFISEVIYSIPYPYH